MLTSAGFAWAPSVRAAACEIPRSTARGLPAAAATPGATPAATPVGTLPTSVSASVLHDELSAVSEALAACLSEGDAEAVTTLAGERFLGQLFGSSVPFSVEDYIAIADELTPTATRIVAVEDVAQTADDRATATVTEVAGNQLLKAEWTFEQAQSGERSSGRTAWKLRSERQLPVDVPRDASTLEVEIRDTSFSLDSATVAGPDVVLRGKNDAAVDHELLVLKFAHGLTTADLLRAAGPNLPEGVTWVGEIAVRTERDGDLVLVDLDPGSYTIVCLFPNANGVPYLADGMEATFTVE